MAKIERAVRGTKKRNKNLSLVDGRLCITTIKEGKPLVRFCITTRYRERIGKEFYDDVISGHTGVAETTTKILNRCF